MSRDSVPTAWQPSAGENTPAARAAAIRPAEYPNSTSGRTPQLSSSRNCATWSAKTAGLPNAIRSSSLAVRVPASANITSSSGTSR